MKRRVPIDSLRFLAIGLGLALAIGASASAQQIDPDEQTGQPFSMEGKSLMQDDTISSDPAREYPNQPVGEIGGVQIESDPNAPQEANEIMDGADNTGVMPPGE